MSDFKIHPTSVLGPHVMVEPGAIIGANCTIEGRTRIGARTTLAGSVALVGDVDVGADCIIEANVSVTTAAASDGPQARPLVIGAKARIGAGAVLSAGVRIGADATVEAGTVVLRDVPAHAVVRGNPGIVVGFHGPAVRAADLIETVADPKVTGVAECGVAGVKIYRFPRVTDPRGSLTFGEFGRNIPFVPKRYFMVFDVPEGELRGGHAHATCEELLLCIGGSVAIVVDDGKVREEIVLDSPDLGLYLPARVWGIQYKYSPDAVLVVLASHYFDPEDYIHTYDDFVADIERRG